MFAGETRYFLQLGAHLGQDVTPGASNDVTAGYFEAAGWSGVLVEPVPALFGELETFLARSKRPLRAVNAAVCFEESASSNVTFYSIGHVDLRTGRSELNGRKLPDWISQVGSLERHKVMEYADPFFKIQQKIEDYIVEIEVPCLTVHQVLETVKVKPQSIIAVLLDTQGMDGRILRSLDLSGDFRPRFIFYEHIALKNVRERQETLVHLWHFGYSCWRWDGGNTWCLALY